MIEKEDDANKNLITEEKDVGKLKLKEIKNALAVPVLDKQNGMPVAVI